MTTQSAEAHAVPASQPSATDATAESHGRVSLVPVVFTLPYSYDAQFGDVGSTNPDELLAAAHAGCFTIALSAVLTEAGHPPSDLRTAARVHTERQGEGYAITLIELDCVGEVPGMNDAEFRRHTEAAKSICPISKALGASVDIAFADVHLREPA